MYLLQRSSRPYGGLLMALGFALVLMAASTSETHGEPHPPFTQLRVCDEQAAHNKQEPNEGASPPFFPTCCTYYFTDD